MGLRLRLSLTGVVLSLTGVVLSLTGVVLSLTGVVLSLGYFGLNSATDFGVSISIFLTSPYFVVHEFLPQFNSRELG
ncbi:MAG: hypothetical protein U5Q03_13790 [Bacteroidota bacterium]|nr:hypothetical protein [Bacteroidota bacterium]